MASVRKMKNSGRDRLLELTYFKKCFDRKLSACLQTKCARVRSTTRNKQIRELVSHVAAIAEADGKRVRPYLAYLGYRLGGGEPDDAILSHLVGIELFHLFALVHDDIIDNASERHGVPTAHIHAASFPGYSASVSDTAKSQAVLAGDLVFLWSHEALLEDLPAHIRPHVSSAFFEMISEVIVGQMIDVDIARKPRSTGDEIEEKNLLKTARYTFVHPLKIGVRLSGKEQTALLDSFSEYVGALLGGAYQVQDDLIDIVGSPSETGKPVLGDVVAGAHTYFTEHVFTKGNQKQKNALRRVFGKPIRVRDHAHVIELFHSSGAVAHGQKLIGRKIAEARSRIQNAPIDQECKDALIFLTEKLSLRTR